MQAILLYIDLTLAVLTLIAAPIAGIRATRRWLWILAVLAAGRLLMALGLAFSGGFVLADSRLTVQVPLALLPAAWAVWKPSRVAANVSAAAGALSVWWLLTPFPPSDAAAILGGSALALALIGVVSTAVGRSESRVARLPWTVAAFLLVPAVTLLVAGQASASAGGHQHGGGGERSVAQLTGPKTGTPDVRLTLTAARTGDRLTFNGTSPGPEIRAKVGQLVEVTLVNRDVAEGVTVHWHGVDVPNAEDGVPGVTQDAVQPGQKHVYRFVPDRAGSFWYHTHSDGLHNVEKGLFGAFVVEEQPFDGVERTTFTHLYPGADVTLTGPGKQAVAAGREVRLRTVNSSREPQRVLVGGTKFRVAAIDGNPVEGATPLEPGTELTLAAGGRYDVEFTMPSGAVTVAVGGSTLTFSQDGKASPVSTSGSGQFDPLTYGTGGPAPKGDYQRTFDLRLDDGFGFSEGRLSYVSSLINGRLWPAVPPLEVAEGDRVKIRIVSRSTIVHPFHLHGHRVRVISRNGDAATGSPWWTDTLDVDTGDVYEVEFVADNPGIWMDHCHNFQHGANGMILHLAYLGVSTPFTADHSPE
ncbi:multicopper oxidase domain-containing protein [Cryptosporangium sp. NPDC048952]|uniref:multicopper oxidase family protein n=1 Tax=Cryptosporangium sp. NPDC048952 TaxID=3363961 RepID=UPI003718CC80